MTIAFINGTFMPEENSPLSPRDRGLTLGDSVFDTLKIRDGRPVQPAAHVARLIRHASIARIQCPVSAEKLISHLHDLISANEFTRGHGVIRTTLTRGIGARGVAVPERIEPTLVMTISAVPPPEDMPDVTAIIAASTRRNDTSPLSRIKSGNYADMVLAMMEARDKDASDALLLNTKNCLTCATTSNIFIVEDGRLVTPLLADGVMDGITRQLVINQMGAAEDRIDEERLLNAEEIWLSNTVSEMRAVSILNEKSFSPYRRRFADLDIFSD